MTNLREVAERAGVSVATASRVATRSTSVRPQTRERVERAMRDLLYVPPRGKAPTGAIGLLVPELTNPVFPALAQELVSAAYRRAPVLNRGVVEIFSHDWSLDSSQAEAELGLRVTPLTEGLALTLARLGR